MTTRSAADVQALLAVLKKRDDAFGVADDPELQAAAAEAAASGFEQARTTENLRGWVNALSASIALGTPLEVLRNHVARLKTVPEDLTRDRQTAERLHALLTALQQEPPRLHGVVARLGERLSGLARHRAEVEDHIAPEPIWEEVQNRELAVAVRVPHLRRRVDPHKAA